MIVSIRSCSSNVVIEENPRLLVDGCSYGLFKTFYVRKTLHIYRVYLSIYSIQETYLEALTCSPFLGVNFLLIKIQYQEKIQ